MTSDSWKNMGGGEPRTPEFARRLLESLTKMREALEQAVDEKQGEVRDLEEKLVQLKHGGGS